VTISGQLDKCPICGDSIVDQYTRIVGYLVPVSAWNKGRQAEHKKRLFKKDVFKNGMSRVEIDNVRVSLENSGVLSDETLMEASDRITL
jgi:hypothetical protein